MIITVTPFHPLTTIQQNGSISLSECTASISISAVVPIAVFLNNGYYAAVSFAIVPLEGSLRKKREPTRNSI